MINPRTGTGILTGITAIIGEELTMSAASRTRLAPGCRPPCRAVHPAQVPAPAVEAEVVEVREVVAAAAVEEVGKQYCQRNNQ